MKLKRFLSGVLCAVMLIALLPAINLNASALEKSDVETDTAGVTVGGYLNSVKTSSSTYYEKSYMRAGIASARFVNGELNAKDGTAPKIPGNGRVFFSFPFSMNNIQVDRLDKNFLDSDNTEMKDENGQPYSVSEFNMFANFGKRGEGSIEPAAGFWTNTQYANCGGCSEGQLTLGGHDGNLNGTSASISVSGNPTLKALAATGDLSFYFSGMLVGATASGCDDGESKAEVYVKLNGTELFHKGKTTSSVYMTTKSFSNGTVAGRTVDADGYIPLYEGDTIDFYFYSADAGCDGWANANIGLSQGLLLFRKTTSPVLEDYVLDSNGDRQSLTNGITEVHLRGDGYMDLQFNFSEPVMTALQNLQMVTPSGKQLMELSSHKLFNNTEGTGYQNQGEPVYMNLSSVNDISGNLQNTETAADQFDSLRKPLTRLTYHWQAGDGDFYGDNALPNDGDWAGDIASSNVFNLIDKIVLASFHDLAGNPLVIQGVPYTYEKGHTEIPQNALTGQVNLNGGYTKSGVANPFDANSTVSSGFDFIIDAVTPTYSVTSNAVQPEILTGLVLNEGDSFEVVLNYSKTVKLRRYFLNGTATNYDQNKLEILFNNGMTGYYKSGLGTKSLTFVVNVPADEEGKASYNINELELTCIRVPDPKNPGGYVTTEVLTDYVGNPLTQQVGDKTIKTNMNWAALSVDNTPPEIEITRVEGVDAFRVTISDNSDEMSGGAVTKSGVYHVSNLTGGEDLQKGLFFYTWIEGEANKEQALLDLAANNYEIVKKYSLGADITASGYKLSTANNGELIDITPEAKSGGTWYLIVIAADMTWDSARQLIQYGKASYQTEPGAYYQNLLSTLGLKLDGDLFELATKAPTNWSEVYTDYYTKTGDTYFKVTKGKYYPRFEANTYYEYVFQELTAEPADWEDNYTSYYQLNGTDQYEHVPAATGVPTWRSGTFYNLYTLVETDPGDIGSNPGSYYLRKDGTYITALESVAPAYVKGNYYSYSSSTGKYTVLSDDKAPSDWNTTYQNYYTKTADEYPNVEGVIPAFEANRYYEKLTGYLVTDPSALIALDTKPANWDSCATDYYQWDPAEYQPVNGAETTYAANTYYSKEGLLYTILTGEEAPADWAEATAEYYSLKKEAQFTKVAAGTSFEAGKYYSEYKLLTEAPEDWSDTYGSYYKMKAGTGKFRTVTEAPKFEAGVHYTAEYELQTSETAPTGWEQKYSYYYTQSGDAYVQASGPKPNFEAGVYYKDKTSEALAAEPADWASNFANYYVKSGNQYVKLGSLNAPEYEANKYYLRKPLELAEEPDDWDDNFASYYKLIPGTYKSIAEQIEASLKFESGKYYTYTGLGSPMADAPDDWKTAYVYYFTGDSKAVQEELFRPYENGKYYGFLPKLLTEEPEDWVTNYYDYVFKSGNNYIQALVTEANRVENVPEFKEGIYFSAASGIASLADKLSSPERRSTFMADLLGAVNSDEQVLVIRKYYEFAPQVHEADVKTMELAANCNYWSSISFQADDSNWKMDYVFSMNDVAAPVAVYQSTSGDDSEDPTVTVQITDDNSINQVEYQFVAKDTVVDDTTESGWVLANIGETPSASLTLELKAADYNKSYAISAGEYDLYVRTKDVVGNMGCSAKLATIKYNPTIDTSCKISDPDGYAPYAKLEGLTATFSGVVNGKNLLDSAVQLKVYAAWDENTTKEDTLGWTELDGTSGVYVIPTLQKVEGFYFLHIKYTFLAGGNTETKYVNQSYMVAGLEAEPVFNLVGSTDDGITVEISAVNAEEIYWQLLENIETELTVDSTGWNKLTTPTVVINKADHPDVENIRIWAKNGTTISSQVFNLNAKASGSGALPTPTVGLADVYQDANNNWYAIIRLTMDEKLLAVGAEYSWAVSDAKVAISAVTWQRWMPYEDTVRVKLSEGTDGQRLLFKFRNGDNVTPEDEYQILTDFSAPDGKPWAIVSRSTLQAVGVKDGVALRFICKDGYQVADAVDNEIITKANGVYSYALTDGNDETEEDGSLSVVVSNIDITPPGFALEWADGGNHEVTGGSVLVTLKPTEDVRITDVTFTAKKADAVPTRAALTSYYTFQENGSVTFTFCDAAGNETKATAKVTWIDNTKPEFTITPDYSAYQSVGTGKNILASGVRLILTPKKVDSFVSSGTDGKDVFYLDVTQNGTYTFAMGDSLGNYVTETYVVSNLVTGQEAPVQTATSVSGGKVYVTVSGNLKGYAQGNRLYDGQSNKCAEIACDANGDYTITKAYSCNGEATAYICDDLGYVTPYKMKIDGLDAAAPTIQLPDGAITIAKGGIIDKNWWINSSGVIFEDNLNTPNELTITTDTPITTGTVGAYSVILTAADTSGNKAYARTTVYVLPVNAMAVTTDKGVLFASESKDAALVDTNTIRLKISNFDLMKFGVEGAKVRNLAATCSVTVKKGIFREGQMKYFETKLRNLTLVEGQNYCTVLLDTDALPGAGWYTIIVRNAEREREFTTFFVNP